MTLSDVCAIAAAFIVFLIFPSKKTRLEAALAGLALALAIKAVRG